ncbi:hypothetical protein L915_09417 [Phytophthora nicotianae]|uniref:Uncharacterized protein n=1 Tax=Phytophthora nicotianae TaxID=4792 RepID=W2IYU3_PHYNI|nr:hypothetical protein L915_09417 [Phytophthora nicotianae]ETL39325.1 hypothetical protein L916_09320 [Phytophthora nicotianae]
MKMTVASLVTVDKDQDQRHRYSGGGAIRTLDNKGPSTGNGYCTDQMLRPRSLLETTHKKEVRRK